MLRQAVSPPQALADAGPDWHCRDRRGQILSEHRGTFSLHGPQCVGELVPAIRRTTRRGRPGYIGPAIDHRRYSVSAWQPLAIRTSYRSTVSATRHTNADTVCHG